MRVRVYIAGAIQNGDIFQNIRQAEDAFKELANLGYAPFCPHWGCYGGNVSPTTMMVDGCMGIMETRTLVARPKPCSMGLSHDQWLDIDESWVFASHALLRLPGESPGADKEIMFANRYGCKIFYDIPTLHNHFEAEKKRRG